MVRSGISVKVRWVVVRAGLVVERDFMDGVLRMRCLALRVRRATRTRWPCCRQRTSMRKPIRPVAPVRKMRVGGMVWFMLVVLTL